MNISTGTLAIVSPDGETVVGSLSEEISEHREILQNTGRVTLTGEVALIADPDPGYPGALQVWSKTVEGMWAWVNPDGEIIEAACPFGE